MHETTTSNLLKSAISAHKEGNFVHAEELYREVISLSPNNLDALHYLALIFISTNQPEVSIPLLNKAVSINGNNPDILYNLALAHQKAENIKSAIHYYELAISLKPDFALAYNNIGVAYQHQGDLTRANQYLEKAFTIAPECTDAYYNFSQSHKFSNEDNIHIKKVEELLNDNKRNKNEEIKLNFSLGKIYDDLSKYKIAFKHYRKANELKNQGFEIEAFKKYVDQLIQCYSPTLLQSLHISPTSSSKSFIFIIGMPRSGTTLIEQIIASHPEVQDAGEVGFVGDIVDELPDLINSNNSYPACMQDIKAANISHISTSLLAMIENLELDCSVITDKSPVNFLHIGLIMMLFPDSKIINCNRNPIDTCLSCFFQNFDKQHQYSYNLKTLALFHNEYTRLMHHWKSLFSDRIYDIKYENMIENQEEESRKLILACDLKWDESCLSFYKSDSVVSTASKWQVRRPIYKTSVEKWKNYEPYIDELIENLDPQIK